MSLSHVWVFATPWTTECQASLSFTISRSLLKLMYIESMMPSNNLILCRPLLLLTSIFTSFRVFSNESALRIRWPNYWSFTISPSNEYSGLISFRIDWFDLLAVQGTLKSLLQHHSSEASMVYINFLKKFLLEYSWFTMLSWFQAYSKLNQLYIYIYPLLFRFFSHIGHHRVLRRVPYALLLLLLLSRFSRVRLCATP